ncbi:DNA binding domain-containing protein, excisionase family [Desulfocicer vacuolatum DSM 3385]|uniref:DNA binding domain-containing protein, excisionase family n=1 Tax=Desulfocicer vacuolatum DSM 3385 TaxID=1121400 RepID=A0A1W2B9M5_9BACT|nr:helix-turn-helix domain-containing protein [Desulfocicer vacuolatum]SMC69491.1 DNA binding domain-containing protein, excisionase family [Desulfocicer vacuolatum DSM 3385]
MSKKITPRTNLTTAITPWLTLKEAAAYLKLNPRTLNNYVSRGLIPISVSKTTNTKRFHKTDLDQWLGKK